MYVVAAAISKKLDDFAPPALLTFLGTNLASLKRRQGHTRWEYGLAL